MMVTHNKIALIIGGLILGLSIYNIVLGYWFEVIVGVVFGFGYIFLNWKGEK